MQIPTGYVTLHSQRSFEWKPSDHHHRRRHYAVLEIDATVPRFTRLGYELRYSPFHRGQTFARKTYENNRALYNYWNIYERGEVYE